MSAKSIFANPELLSAPPRVVPWAATTGLLACCRCCDSSSEGKNTFGSLPSTVSAPLPAPKHATPEAPVPMAAPRVPPLAIRRVKEEENEGGLSGAVLSRVLVSQVIASSSGGAHRKLIKLAHNDTVADALATLAESNILAAPVMVYPNRRNGSVSDSESQDESAQTETMIGWADVRELLKSFVTTHAQKLAFVSAVSAWDSALDAVAADFVQRKLVSVCGDDGQLLPQIDGDSMTLLDAVKQGFLSTGGDERTLTPRSGGTPGACPVVHRLALFKGGHISAILSQSDIMTYLLRQSSLMGPELCGATVDQLGFAGGRRVVCVTPSTPTHAAFTIMFSHGVSGVGVVGAQEELLGNLSASDLRRLQPHNLRVLALPIGEFLAALYGEPVAGYAPSADTYLQFARGPPGSAAVRKPVTVEPHTPFLSVLELLGSSSPRIHRVYVTEHGRPIGVITATDVLRMLAKREGGATEMVSPMDSQ